MDSFAIVFTKASKEGDPTPTMVILAKSDRITAYGLGGISGIIVDDMNERFGRLSGEEIVARAKMLKESYVSDSTGYGSSVAVLPYAENKRMVDKMINHLTTRRSDAIIQRASRGRV